MKILVDADASPVVGITIDTARKYQVAVELFLRYQSSAGK